MVSRFKVRLRARQISARLLQRCRFYGYRKVLDVCSSSDFIPAQITIKFCVLKCLGAAIVLTNFHPKSTIWAKDMAKNVFFHLFIVLN